MNFHGGRGGGYQQAMNRNFYLYAEELKNCIGNCDGEKLKTFFSLTRKPPQLLQDMSRVNNIENECWKYLGDVSDFVEIFVLSLQASVFLAQGQAGEAYNQQLTLLQKSMDVLKEQSHPWMMPVLHIIVEDTRIAATAADEQTARTTGKSDHEKLRDCERIIKLAFTFCVTDRKSIRDPGSKKSGFLHVVVILFKTYFQLNTLRLCKNIIKSISRPGLVDQEDCFAKSDLVAYKYYVGRLNMFEDQYEEAEVNLGWALAHCHPGSVRNKRRILNYLVPIKLVLGKLPTPTLLKKYGLTHFLGLVQAVKQGDLRAFNKCLDGYQSVFILHGTYLMLEKLKVVVYRNLFKRVYLILNNPKIKLDQFTKTFEWLGVPMDMEEIECILANLIYKGYIKGYISHNLKVLVLSKKNPFPFEAVVKG
mmetsp:Transcript_12891/g.16830  ORF Transcript_12891/g.16830 Transcript_12891/m.16830 type:complete len:420 (+) Transcript_12891:39-1298(+)